MRFYYFYLQNKTMLSRVREFGDLRQSRSSKKDNLGQSFVSKGAFQTPRSEFGKASATSFKSEYVCINCINKNMSSNKRDHEHHRFITQQSRYNDLQRSRRVYEQQLTKSRQRKQGQDKRKLNDYNRSLIKDHQKHRQKQLRSRQNARLKEQEEAAQYQQMIEKEQARRQRQKELFRTQIQNQINQKHQKRLRQQMKQRYPEPLPQDDDWINSAKSKNRDKYRQQLQDQIKENQQRRQRQKHNTSMQDQRFLNDLLDSNSKKYHENELSIKRQLQEDALAFQQSKQAKRRQKEQKLQRQKMQALINQEFQEKQLHENEKMKNDRINRYKQDIERQIRENDQKRNKLRNADKMNYNSTIGLTQEEIERRLCGSCDKTYPKKYLTKVK